MPLDFDPIERAGQLWEEHWPGEDSAVYDSMRAVTSIMRVQQVLLAELDARLKPFGLTFSRYEALVLLSFSAKQSLPLSKMGERLQVHATSITNIVDRLEAAGLVRREPNPQDGRGTLAVLTEAGARVVQDATAELNKARFGLEDLSHADLGTLFAILRRFRERATDFTPEQAR